MLMDFLTAQVRRPLKYCITAVCAEGSAPGIHTEISAWGEGVLCHIPLKKKKGWRLLHLIAIERPDLSAVNFDEFLDIFKQKNRRIRL